MYIASPLTEHLHILKTTIMLVMILIFFGHFLCFSLEDLVTMCVESSLQCFKLLGISSVLRSESGLSSSRFCLLLADDDFLIQMGERLLNIY